MTKPAAIIFDLGKVLVDFDYLIAARNLAATGKVSLRKIGAHFGSLERLHRYETGLMSREEFYDEFCAGTGYSGSITEFGSFFSDIFTEIPEMVGLHAALRRKGFPTYIFSNTNDLAVEHIEKNFPFFKNFDGYIYSYQVQAMKPDAKIYEAMERRSGHRGAELLYIDDRPENIEAGARRGWQTILQEHPQKTRAALQKLGVLD